MPVTDAADNSVDPATLPHDSRRDDVVACAVVCFAIAALFVGLRFYTRTKIVKVLAASDWFLLAALVRTASPASSAVASCSDPLFPTGRIGASKRVLHPRLVTSLSAIMFADSDAHSLQRRSTGSDPTSGTSTSKPIFANCNRCAFQP